MKTEDLLLSLVTEKQKEQFFNKFKDTKKSYQQTLTKRDWLLFNLAKNKQLLDKINEEQ